MSSPVTTDETKRTSRLTDRDRLVLDAMFSIDSRALAVVRIILASLVLFHALVGGMGPESDPGGGYGFVTDYAYVAIVPFAVMLLVGYRARLAVIACWLLYSLPIRADLMADVQSPMGYFLLNLGLFWCMFLPIDRHLSFESRRRGDNPVRFLSVASGALLFQVFVVYFSAGLYKDMGEWLFEATAMQSILGNPRYMTALGNELLGYPTVLAVMSVATIVLEVVGALLVMVPGKTLQARRTVIVPVFIIFHIGIAVLMGIGLFPYVMIALWLLFLPSSAWQWIWQHLGLGDKTAQPQVDHSGWRNALAGSAALVAVISNFITWIVYPQFRNVEGVAGAFQDFALFLLLYQQWVMFNVPSMIPV